MVFQRLKNHLRKRRRARVRARIFGTPEKPRLSVYRSLTSIYAQIIDDVHGKTIASASSRELDKTMKKMAAAEKVGELVADKTIKRGVSKVVFDRSHYKFHGRIKALAEAARKKGLQF